MRMANGGGSRHLPCKAMFILLLAISLLFASCGSADEDRAGEEPVGPDAPATDAVPETRIVTTALGEVQVPSRPQRVVTLRPGAFYAAVDVGITPIASVANVTSAYEEALGGVEVLLDGREPDFEEIAAADPDLILTQAFEGEVLPQGAEVLAEVAPVVAFIDEGSDSWKETFRQYADALNRVDEAETALTEYDARVDDLRTQLGPGRENLEVRVVNAAPEGPRVYLRDTFPGSILDDVGFARPEGEPAEGFSLDLSLERIPELDADHIFVFTFGVTDQEAEQATARLDELQDHPLWRSLNAAQEGRVYLVGDYWIFGAVSGAEAVLQDLVENLVEETP